MPWGRRQAHAGTVAAQPWRVAPAHVPAPAASYVRAPGAASYLRAAGYSVSATAASEVTTRKLKDSSR
jgi:hypothetical protein